MKILRKIKGIRRADRIANDTIRNELTIEPLEEKVKIYKNKWKEHVERMTDYRILQKMLR